MMERIKTRTDLTIYEQNFLGPIYKQINPPFFSPVIMGKNTPAEELEML
jgi:hypothetical protein